jgi:large conductance mechanosensitive channel
MAGFKEFVLRGNVVDLAVGVVVGAAFGAVVTEFTKDLLTPLIAALVGKPDFSALQFEVNALMARVKKEPPPADPTTKKCPECLSEIPLAAKRCAFCTSQV